MKIFEKSMKIKANCEIEDVRKLYDWKNLYKNVNSKKNCSDTRSFYYRLINNGISLGTKIQKLNKNIV